MTKEQVQEALVEAFDLDTKVNPLNRRAEATFELKPQENDVWSFTIQSPTIDFRYDRNIIIQKFAFANGQVTIKGEYHPKMEQALKLYDDVVAFLNQTLEAEAPMTTKFGLREPQNGINHDVLYIFASKDLSYGERLLELENRIVELKKWQASDFEKNALKEALKMNLEKEARDAEKGIDAKYLTVRGGKSWTIRELLHEIEQETPFGLSMMRKFFNLSLNLLTRGKEELCEDYNIGRVHSLENALQALKDFKKLEVTCLKDALKLAITSQAKGNLQGVYLKTHGGRRWTFEELLNEIELETSFGIEYMADIIRATIESFAKQAEKGK